MTTIAPTELTPATHASLESARTEPGYLVADQYYPTLSSLAVAFGVKVTTLARRMRSKHWTIEQACGLKDPPVSAANQGKKLEVDGQTFPSMAAACLAYGIKVEVYHARRRTGWSIEEALEIVARPDAPRPGAKTWSIAGKTYFSLRKACEAHGLNPDRIRSRLSMGWTLEEAFDLAQRQPPAPVPAALRKGETGTLIICGQTFVWKGSSEQIPELSSISTRELCESTQST
jgi:hypothetical protein